MVMRKAAHPIEKLILDRWSPRAMSGEPLEHKEFMRLIEAARWAPSSYNSQPWRFVYAHRSTPEWQSIFDLLIPFNQEWCKNAAVLVVILSLKNFDYNKKPSRTHSFCTGSAWQNIALQGWSQGLVVHGMEGFDYDRARSVLSLPDDVAVEAMCAIGKPAPKDTLPSALQAQEERSDRLPADSLVFNGVWRAEK